jgi:CO/xanthine dehydrogenase FAD-binding subunit
MRMIIIDEYVRPRNVSDAYALLITRSNPAIIGGGVFMRLASREIGTAIDLSEAGLDFIKETSGHIEIGSMVTFGELERNPLMNTAWGGLISTTVKNIVGIQMRNMVTVGGTVFGRYGFSEFITCLLALKCSVVLHKHGVMKLEDFLNTKGLNKDILEKIVISKQEIQTSYKTVKKTSNSLPLLSVAVSRCGSEYRISVGARPAVATLAKNASQYLHAFEVSRQMKDDIRSPIEAAAQEAANIAASELTFTSDRKASAEYRWEICEVLIRRAILEVQK